MSNASPHDAKLEALREKIRLLQLRAASTSHDSEKTRLDLILRSLEHELDRATYEPAAPARPVAFRVQTQESSHDTVLRSIASTAATQPRY